MSTDGPHRLSRREFVVTTLAAGFALAVQPVSAETISTSADGLTAGEVKIPTAGGDMPAYRAMPAAKGSYAIVLVVHEIFGVHEYIKDVCRRLAKRGYFAVAPALFARQGDVSKLANVQDIIAQVVSKVPDAQIMSDLDATVAWAGKSGGNANAVAITGFCWGGRVVWLYAAHSSTLKSGVAWYGRLVGPTDELHAKNRSEEHTSELQSQFHLVLLSFPTRRSSDLRVVWLYAAHSSTLKSGVAWYGRLVGPTDELHAKN